MAYSASPVHHSTVSLPPTQSSPAMRNEKPQNQRTKKNWKFEVAERESEGDEERRSLAMFYSQCLLSKKGPLAAIWVAGCCFKRLKKRQVTDTHIPSSVDKILLEGLPSVTYRILAYLLLGVVRIYSRKVECLFKDCHETVLKINKFSVGKKVIPFRDLVRSSCSIILPERYELDVFQVEGAEGASGFNIAQNEDIAIPDAVKDTYDRYSLDKNPFGEIAPQWEADLNASLSAGDTAHQETCLSARTPDKVTGNWGTSTGACTPPDKVLSPHLMEIDTEVTTPDCMKNLQTSKEKLRELRFTQEEFMDVDMICGADVELLNLINEYQVQKADDDWDDLEKVMLQNHDHVIFEDKGVPSPMGKIPNLEIPDAAVYVGGTIQDFLAVTTPANNENIRRSRKRKCIIDETLVLHNQVMKQIISDASSLVCKRRKAPHTVIDIWRFSHIPTISKKFLEPLLPCAALDLRHAHGKKRTERIEQSSNAVNEIVETTETLKPPPVAVSPRTPVDSRSAIAPGTPVRAPTSARFFASPRTADSDGEGLVHLYENARKELSGHEGDCPNLLNEVGANEGDSEELHKNKNGWSARTRTIARYLHQVIHKRKQQGEEGVALLPILERKTRAENARFFFEILVLTSGGYVNVKQERAYGQVLLQETIKMEATAMTC